MVNLIIYSKIDSVNQRSNSVFRIFEMFRQVDVVTFICMATLSNLQLPLYKLALFSILCVQSHVDFQMKDFDVVPENRVLQGSTNNLRM